MAIQQGLDPLLAVQMATLNAAECYGLSDRGALAPGYLADFIMIDDLENFVISNTFKSGKVIAE